MKLDEEKINQTSVIAHDWDIGRANDNYILAVVT